MLFRSMDKKSHSEDMKEKEYEDLSKLSDEEFFSRVFPNLNEENWEEELKSNDKYPYVIRLVNISNPFHNQKCFYCDKIDCDNCFAPFRNDLRVQDLLNKMKQRHINNDYYFFEHSYYSTNGKKQFEFEIIFRENSGIKFYLMNDIVLSKDYNLMTKEYEVNIYDCLDQLNEWENFVENDSWYCSICKDSVKAQKRIEIFKAPPILILHLKRFNISDEVNICRIGEANNTLVHFPLLGLDTNKYNRKSKISTKRIF